MGRSTAASWRAGLAALPKLTLSASASAEGNNSAAGVFASETK